MSFVRSYQSNRQRLKGLLAGLFSLALVAGAGAQTYIDTFNVGSGVPADNSSQPLVNYTTPIDATNFFNDAGSQFSWDLGDFTTSWQNSLYNGWHHTLNFTNLGEMDADTGFFFERQLISTNMAANFYNVGNILCGTSGTTLIGITIIGNNVVYYGNGAVYVYATNIFNQGTIDVGANGFARFTGNNVNFPVNSTIFIESSSSTTVSNTGAVSTYPNIDATGQTGLNTNAWVPSQNLGLNSAFGPLNVIPFGLQLVNSVPYYSVVSDSTGTNLIIRMILLEDNSFDVTTNVYIDAGNGNGFAHVEWVGNYIDPGTGQTLTSYFYLDDDYAQGSATNILKFGPTGNGVPSNYTFTQTSTRRSLGPTATTGLPPVPLPSNAITNNVYSYVDANVIATSVTQNNAQYGTIPLNQLPGHVEINATTDLNLSLATIVGMNYLLLNSTNEFDSDGQSDIISPYYDIYLGHTNGTMVASNLVPANIPAWSGSVFAYNTRFTNQDANFTYDFRVLLVSSQLSPTTTPLVENFALYSSNNVVISDVLDIVNSLYLNCTNLLLTFNGNGNGADSPYGAIAFQSSTNSWATSLPRLRCLTNNGLIETLNTANYGSSATPYLALYNSGEIYNSGGSTIYSQDFEDYGYFDAGTGSFALQSLTATFLGDFIIANGSCSLTAPSLVASLSTIEAGKSLTLSASNLLTDMGIVGNNWSLGSQFSGVGNFSGLTLTNKPASGDLLGTTITCVAPTNSIGFGGTVLLNTWAGQNRGISNAGYTNNAAVGQLVLDAQGSAPHTLFTFVGAGTNKAIYVDELTLTGFATNVDASFNLTSLNFTNPATGGSLTNDFIIYYAQATMNGVTVAEKINHKNGDHLRWVPTYAGYFSSTNVVGPPGVTNVENAALAVSSTIDSDGDGLVNGSDSVPFFVPQMIDFTIGYTNAKPTVVQLTWQTPTLATNYIYYTTNLLSPWQPFNAFGSYYWSNGTAVAVANSAHTNWFVSPQAYPNPPTNVWIFDTITNMPHFYQVVVQPNLLFMP